jgi:asparagine synthase (glutamine-hydrolysing)
MCGIAGILGRDPKSSHRLSAMMGTQTHRGPDASGAYLSPTALAALGHNRLSILDLSDAGRQPMSDSTGRYWIIFNGEVYNYLELRNELGSEYVFRTQTDTEVVLASYVKWGEGCLERFIGMFAFIVWDEVERRAFGARDRFGVKPLYIHESPDGCIWCASEIKALHAAGVPREEDERTWATYLASGMHDHRDGTFWRHVWRLGAGSSFRWTPEGGLRTHRWYDLAEKVSDAGIDRRPEGIVVDELLGLLEETVQLRFRADVPVGVCLSGGLDSSLLLGLIHRVQGRDSEVRTFTFHCGDPAYDEVPWVKKMLAKTRHPACFSQLTVAEVAPLAERLFTFQDEPYGGLPTLGMAKVHECARKEGTIVVLDGNGLDEAWGGYDYYRLAEQVDVSKSPVQGATSRATRPDCLSPEFLGLAEKVEATMPFGDPLRDLQYRDICSAKIPRAMRFADRVSMMFSRELREPFLDHRIMELGVRQPAHHKIRHGQGKWLVRRLAQKILPAKICTAQKRAVQTPQREWLRQRLQVWLRERVECALRRHPGWFNAGQVRSALRSFLEGEGDNSFFVWQWISAAGNPHLPNDPGAMKPASRKVRYLADARPGS